MRGLFLILGVLAFTLPVFAQNMPGAPVACTQEARICPDGTAVGRTGPHCEFTPCPGESPVHPPTGPICNMAPFTCPDGTRVLCKPCPGASGSGSGSSPGSGAVAGSSGSAIALPAKVANMDDPGLARYPDLPLFKPSSEPMTLEFTAHHRSALSNKRVTVHGVIVNALLGGHACPNNPQMAMACAQPRIVLADTGGEARDKNYDTVVLLQMSDKTAYETGQVVSVTGTVMANKNSVIILKDYDVR